MAILNKTGITDGSTIQSEHVTRTIDALTGVSTDTIVATGSFTGSFKGSLIGTASFAATASYALNANASPQVFTIQMMHLKQINTSAGTKSYFAPFASDTFPSAGRIGYSLPAATTIISASVFVHSSVVDINAQNVYSLVWNNGGGYLSSSIADVKLTNELKYESAILNQPVSASSVISIQMQEVANSTAEFVSTVLLTLKTT
jgi:hypothetical protein